MQDIITLKFCSSLRGKNTSSIRPHSEKPARSTLIDAQFAHGRRVDSTTTIEEKKKIRVRRL